MGKNAYVSIGRVIAGFGRGCRNALTGCLRGMWNLLCIGTGLFFGFGSCLAVFALGVLAVLLILGYPLAGITIAWLGLTMCIVSVTIWCFSMMAKSDKKCPGKAEENNAGILPSAYEEQTDADMVESRLEEKEEMVHA